MKAVVCEISVSPAKMRAWQLDEATAPKPIRNCKRRPIFAESPRLSNHFFTAGTVRNTGSSPVAFSLGSTPGDERKSMSDFAAAG